MTLSNGTLANVAGKQNMAENLQPINITYNSQETRKAKFSVNSPKPSEERPQREVASKASHVSIQPQRIYIYTEYIFMLIQPQSISI